MFVIPAMPWVEAPASCHAWRVGWQLPVLLALELTFCGPSIGCQVTSSAKRKLKPGSAKVHQTPDGSFYDLQLNAAELLQRCGFDVPEVRQAQGGLPNMESSRLKCLEGRQGRTSNGMLFPLWAAQKTGLQPSCCAVCRPCYTWHVLASASMGHHFSSTASY